MKEILSKLMGLTMVAMLLFAAAGIRLNARGLSGSHATSAATASRQLSDKNSREIVGGECSPVVKENALIIAILLGQPALAALYLATHC